MFVRLVERLDWSRTRFTKSDILRPGRACVLVGGGEHSKMIRTTSKHSKKSTLFWLFTDMLCYGNKTMLGRYVVHKVLMFESDHVFFSDDNGVDGGVEGGGVVSHSLSLTIKSDEKTFNILFKSYDVTDCVNTNRAAGGMWPSITKDAPQMQGSL